MVEIRAATLNDIPRIAKVHIDTWRLAYRGIMPDSLLDNLSTKHCENMWQGIFLQKIKTIIAELEGHIVGFSTFGASRDEISDSFNTQEIQSINISPPHWEKNIGSLLCKNAISQMKNDKISKIILWVFTENHRARAFYEKMGFSLTTNIKTEWNSLKIEQIQYQILI